MLFATCPKHSRLRNDYLVQKERREQKKGKRKINHAANDYVEMLFMAFSCLSLSHPDLLNPPLYVDLFLVDAYDPRMFQKLPGSRPLRSVALQTTSQKMAITG